MQENFTVISITAALLTSPPSSNEIRDLMECMMDKDPFSRIGMDEIRVCPFIM